MPTLRSIARKARGLVDLTTHTVGLHESEAKLAADAQEWWTKPPSAQKQGVYSHWRDNLGEEFDQIGRHTYDIYRLLARGAGFEHPPRRVIEWGCGGGANGIPLARECEQFYGLDVVQVSLDECQRQFQREALPNFNPVLIDITTPENVLTKITAPCDLFVAVNVFEVFPSPEYGARVLKIAAQLLRPGGMAMIQIRYSTTLTNRSRRWGYKFGVASMTAYRIEEFWQVAQTCGLDPRLVHLVPALERNGDCRYAYFGLIKS